VTFDYCIATGVKEMFKVLTREIRSFGLGIALVSD